MGSTITYALPYPELTDVANVPADMRELAERTEAVLTPYGSDTGWQAVAVNAGFAAESSNPPQVRRIGSVVYWRGGFTNTGMIANTSNIAGTVPAGFRPVTGKTMMTATGSAGNALAAFVVTASGPVQIRTGATVGSSYITDTTWTIN